MPELTDTQLEYIDWRADPHRSGSKAEWAREHHVAERTLRDWDKKPWFRQGLERRLAELNVSPDRLQALLDTLWREGAGGDANAARLYFQLTEHLRPPAPKAEDAAIAALSDAELEIAFNEGLAELKRRRELA